MEVGAPVWVFDRELWHEAVVAAPVDASSGLVECAIEPEPNDENLVTPEGDDVVPDAQDFQTPRKRRNSRRNSMRRAVSIKTEFVLPRNQGEHYHTVQDLTKLVHLHEPAILQVLRRRFFHGEIYTSTGQILVAMNPFRRLSLYSDDIKDQYYDLGGNAQADKSTLAPHVYSVADQAFRTMLVPRSGDNKTDQTILVSGESGAGKTETTKLIMNYLAYVSTKRTRRPIRASNCDQTTIHDRVLESNPILEAFGNARTTRNNNSSRFGKFIKLGFTSSGEMLGASISTYLLERVRLVSQGKGERNYHVFYEMCGGSSASERQELALLDLHEYAYLNQSECYERLDGVNDAESYQVTRRAMSSIGMSPEEQLNVMKIVSAVLHLGNLCFTTATRNGGKDDASVVDMDECGDNIKAICSLLGVEEDVLRSTLCSKKIKAGAEFITTRLPVAQALSTRDSVVKTLYSNLFNWLVDRINRSIEYKEEAGGNQFIGVVDIFGCILSQIPSAQGQVEKEVALQMVEKLAGKLQVDTDAKHPPFQVGKTKVFCVLEAHQALETARSKALYKSVITLQRYCLGYTMRARYQRKRRSSIRIQAIWRSWSCWHRYQRFIRRERAALKLQCTTRGFLARKQLKRIHAVTVIQSFVRGWLVRREYSANTLSFEHDVSYVGSLDERSTTASSISLSESISKDRKNTTISFQSSVSTSDYSDTDGSISIRSSSRISRKKMIEEYEPPTQIQNEYEIVWECGLLGLYFESDPISGMPIVRRVHESLSNCADIFEVSRGDVLLAVGKVKVKKGDIRRILTLLQEVQKPVRLHFLRNPTESFRLRSGSLELLGEEDYEVLWKEGVPLGLGFRPDPSSGYPCVLQSQGNQLLPGMFNVRAGDHLVFINEFSTQGVRFQKVIDILESGPRPAVLRFRHTDLVEDPQHQLDQTMSLDSSVLSNPQDDSHSMGMSRLTRPSRVSMNPKNDHSLYYITWKEEDGPLGIVVKQESTSYYPRVINVKSEGAVTRESQKNRVEIGDVLLSINNNNISKMGFGAAMKLLQKGPKPLLLMFQRPRTSLSMTTRSCNL
ncbi:hypothetical protein PC112_g228 [Phytophthora cactorum]|nr:hypothetical protein PC112_g228 [Phytophthora cactorum]